MTAFMVINIAYHSKADLIKSNKQGPSTSNDVVDHCPRLFAVDEDRDQSAKGIC